MKRETTMLALAALLSMCAAAEDRIAYKGRLEKADGSAVTSKTPLEMTFSVYSQAEGGTPLWARRIAVRMESDGTFYTELADGEGNSVSGAQYTKLSAAFAAAGDSIYIGISPGEGLTELFPRDEVVQTPYAARATVAMAADRIETTALSATSLDLPSASVRSLSVSGSLQRGSGAEVVYETSGAELAASGSTKVTRGIKGITSNSDNTDSNATAKSDTLTVSHDYDNVRGGGYFTNVTPAGRTVYHEGPRVRTTSLGAR